jgi:L,D-transpeptidase YbiS
MSNESNTLSVNVSISAQTLTLCVNGVPFLCYRVSTALNGVGEYENSGCTPRGHHIIRASIGKNEPINSVFIGRRPTGEVFNEALVEQFPKRDWILSRILWLSGCEPGINRLGNVDTMRRYIYIHGTPDTEPMGQALSHGCIRMKNQDIIDLFDRVSSGVSVCIS